MKRNLLIILIITSGVFGAEHIRPSEDQETDVNTKEGEPVILKCSYDSSSDYVSLYWYRQYPNRALQYLLYRGDSFGNVIRSYGSVIPARDDPNQNSSSPPLNLEILLKLIHQLGYVCLALTELDQMIRTLKFLGKKENQLHRNALNKQ
ncbi:hypothetical protein SRHO_G00019800 [Serrasalmus rhombeus]